MLAQYLFRLRLYREVEKIMTLLQAYQFFSCCN